MKRISTFAAAALAVALLAGQVGTAAAQTISPPILSRMLESYSRTMTAPTPIQSQQVLPIRALIAAVQSQRGGTFINVLGGLQGGDRPYYIFRWRFPNGIEQNLMVDATSGQVVG